MTLAVVFSMNSYIVARWTSSIATLRSLIGDGVVMIVKRTKLTTQEIRAQEELWV